MPKRGRYRSGWVVQIRGISKLTVPGQIGKGEVKDDVTSPEYSQSEVGDVNSTTIEVLFSENVNSADFSAGVTIKVNAVSRAISSATQQANQALVYYVVASQVNIADSVTWEYDDAVGDIEDDSNNALLDVTAQTTVNFVGSHFYFDEPDDSAHLAHI
jgi:hypothetical protein